MKKVSKAEIKRRRKLWADALESGKYKQTTETLRNGRSAQFCCLGVACDVFKGETGDGKWTREGVFVVGDDREENYLPAPVRNWFGVTENPVLRASGSYTATELNDEQGADFDEIARLVRRLPL